MAEFVGAHLRHQGLLGRKMPVEPAMRQTGPVHDGVDADAIDAMPAEQGAGGVQDAPPRLGFAVGEMVHRVPFGGGPIRPPYD